MGLAQLSKTLYQSFNSKRELGDVLLVCLFSFANQVTNLKIPFGSEGLSFILESLSGKAGIGLTKQKW